MRIAILGTRGIPARYGGFETFAEQLAVRLASMNVEVTVYCEADRRTESTSYKGVRLKYIHALVVGPLSTILFDIRCLWDARRDYDVVYMLGYGTSLFCFLPRFWGRQVWINMDGIEWARSKWNKLAKIWFKIMEKSAVWSANRLIADAEGIRQHLLSRHKDIPPCSVIPYGAPILDNAPEKQVLQELHLNESEYYLVVCRLEPENHVAEIIEGFKASSSPFKLVIVGNHKSNSDYVKTLLTIKDDRIIFAGTIYDEKKLQALRFHALAYMHGHSVGGTNPSLLEALGCGNIVIAHDNVFNREVAGDVALFFRSSLQIPEIISEIESYTREQKMQKIEKARTIACDKYDWDKIAEKYLTLLNASVKESKKARPSVP